MTPAPAQSSSTSFAVWRPLIGPVSKFNIRNGEAFNREPGCISTTVLRSIGSGGIATYARWRSAEAFAAAFAKLTGNPARTPDDVNEAGGQDDLRSDPSRLPRLRPHRFQRRAPMTSPTDTSRERVPIVISGAGPVGLSLALLLARAGEQALVLEKKAGLDTHSRATLIVPRSLDLFRRLGVLDDFLAQGVRNDAIRLLRASDRHRLLTFDFSILADRTPTPFALALSQDRTERILLRAIEATGTAKVAFSTPFERFEPMNDRVRVHAAGRVIDADLLVGADGAHSGVRNQLGWRLEGRTYPTRAVLADVRIAPERDTDEGWLVDPDAEAFTLAIRFADGIWRLIESSVPETVTHVDLPARAARITERLFGARAWRQTLWTAAYRKHERRAERYVEGRVVLAGDAAHLNSPAGGQGMNAGLADADLLGQAIIGGRSHPVELPALLSGYERERIEAFDHDIRGLTDALETMETIPAWVRRLAFGAIGLARAFGVERAVANKLSMLSTRIEAR